MSNFLAYLLYAVIMLSSNYSSWNPLTFFQGAYTGVMIMLTLILVIDKVEKR